MRHATLLTTVLLAASASAQTQREIVETNADGAQVVRMHGKDTRQAPGPFVQRAGIIWHVHDNVSITNSVAVSDTTDETWVGHNLNSERLSFFQTTGSGVPGWEVDLTPEEPSTVVVASAEDASMGVLLVKGLGETDTVSVRAYTGTGGPPLWNYGFPGNFTSTGFNSLDVSDDGSIVAAVGNDPVAATSLVVILDGSNGSVIQALTVPTFVNGVELSDDGSRMVTTEGATAAVYDTATLFFRHSFSVSGTGGFHRISGDGKTVVAGGFNLRVFRDYDHGIWMEDYSAFESSQWFGWGVALSDDGNTLFSVSHTYLNYLELTYRVIDVANGVETARTTTLGTGTLQDSIRGAQSSADGDVLACMSWGTEHDGHAEVQVFDRDLNLIGGVDTPGSPFDIDLTRDGRYLVIGSKAVHANIFGNGSDTYAYEVDLGCAADWNGDGLLNTSDFLDYLNDYNDVRFGGSWTFGDPDLADPFGILNTSDFLAFLNRYTLGCP